jgi:hypothetical protein
MMAWLETLGVIALAVGGAGAGWWFSKLPGRWWLLGYFIPLAVVVAIGCARWFTPLAFIAPFSWLVAGRTAFALFALLGPLLLTTPMRRLNGMRLRWLVAIFGGLIVVHYSLFPFLFPALTRNALLALKTRVDGDGICLQSNDYCCGPAASVTALRRLGFSAEEGELAVLMHTSAVAGTPGDILARALQKKYGPLGLLCEYRWFKDLSELKRSGLTIAQIKYDFWVDHYVTVLEVNDREIIVGDPVSGISSYSPDEFKKKWRFCGIVCGTAR